VHYSELFQFFNIPVKNVIHSEIEGKNVLHCAVSQVKWLFLCSRSEVDENCGVVLYVVKTVFKAVVKWFSCI